MIKRILIPYLKASLGVGLGWLVVLLMWLPLTIEPFDAHRITFVKAAGPLPNGVAAGDTTSTSTVLWTRGTVVGPVSFAYSTDPTFNTQVQTTTTTITTLLQPVKVEITGLNPATTYYYRATDADGSSASGRFRTAAPTGVHTGLHFGVSGDYAGYLAPFPAITNADERNLDFFVELGDTTYSDLPSPALPISATTVADYRLKYNEIYSTHLGLNAWADLRGSTSILATIDDHEVRNDFAGGAAPSSDPRFDNTGVFYINETQLYNNALQVFQEYKPLQDRFYGGSKRKLYRFNTYGQDAAVFILDTRSFRDEPLTLDLNSQLSVINYLQDSLNDTNRTFLGAQQLADLKANLLQAQASGITWKFIFVSGPIQNLGVFSGPDRYEGYAAERTNLLRFINQNGIENVVFIAASLHGTIVNNLTYQETPFGPQIPTGAFEVIAGPVAIYPPFGPAVVPLAQNYGLITQDEVNTYNSLSRAGKDEFVRQLVDEELLARLGYDLTGLNGSGIDATLLQGGYVAVHTFGWTEFEISQSTQSLLVTTYGIDSYSSPDPGITTRTPAIVSQFIVNPGRTYLPLISK